MLKVEGEGCPIDTHLPLRASCNYFFFEASRINSVEAISSMSTKLLLLFYQIRYSRVNKRHCFGF